MPPSRFRHYCAAIPLFLASGLLVPGCGKAHLAGPRPAMTLSSNTLASREMQAIRDNWSMQALAAPDSRAELRARLTRFRQGYPGDPLLALADAHEAWLDLEEGAYPRAEATLRGLEKLPDGWVHDFATVLRGRDLRLTGHGKQAYTTLEPLAGKLVDPVTISLFLEEIALSALSAGKDYEAIFFLDGWFRSIGEDEQRDRTQTLEQLLASVSAEALERTLVGVRQGTRRMSPEIVRIVTDRLSTIAVDTKDFRLARWLAEKDARASSGDTNARLFELATREQLVVKGRTVGLILSSKTTSLRDASADVARGIAWALGLPKKTVTGDDGTRLVTRDEPGGAFEGALDELAGDGASIIIAGYDEASSGAALAWSEKTKIPVIVLSSANPLGTGGFGFALGTARKDSITTLLAAFRERNRLKIAPIADQSAIPIVTSIFQSQADLTLAPTRACDGATDDQAAAAKASWDKLGFRTWMVVGSARCARDTARLLEHSQSGLIGLTLDAMGDYETLAHVKTISVGAGLLPALRTPKKPKAGTAELAMDPDMNAFVLAFGTRPHWAAALGRDAGKLAAIALQSIPISDTTDKIDVGKRRALVRAALEKASLPLWTTEATAFGADHRMPRTLRVVELE